MCSYVYLLNYRSNLETRYRYHPRSQSYQKTTTSMQVQSAIMGRVVLGTYFQMVFGTDLPLLKVYNSDFTVQRAVVQGQSSQKLVFSDAQIGLEHISQSNLNSAGS